MPRIIDISFVGDPRLEKRLNDLGTTSAKRVVRKAARRVGRRVQKDAKTAAPRGETGELRRNIKVRALKRSRRNVGVIVRTGTRGEMGIPQDSPWYYPAIVEYGHARAAPRPYLRPAIDRADQYGPRMFADLVRAGIKEEAERLRRKQQQRQQRLSR